MFLRVFVFLLALLFSAGVKAQCVESGGYPWGTNACFRVSDLDKALELNPGIKPPSNVNGQGANYGKLWLDQSVTPYVVRMCRINGCAPTFNSAQWSNIFTVDPTTGAISLLNITTTPARRILSGTTDPLLSSDAMVVWQSSAAVPKTETLGSCTSANSGETHEVADGANTAGTYPITLQAPSGTSINGTSTFPLNINRASVLIVCDGLSNWVIVNNNITLAQIIAVLGFTPVNLGFTPLNPALNLSDVNSAITSLTNLETQTILTGTGAQNICAATVVTIWRPTTPADATFTLPAVPAPRQRCVIQNESSSSAFAATVAASGGGTILGLNGTGNVLLGPPGSSIVLVYNSTNFQWGPE